MRRAVFQLDTVALCARAVATRQRVRRRSRAVHEDAVAAHSTCTARLCPIDHAADAATGHGDRIARDLRCMRRTVCVAADEIAEGCPLREGQLIPFDCARALRVAAIGVIDRTGARRCDIHDEFVVLCAARRAAGIAAVGVDILPARNPRHGEGIA